MGTDYARHLIVAVGIHGGEVRLDLLPGGVVLEVDAEGDGGRNYFARATLDARDLTELADACLEARNKLLAGGVQPVSIDEALRWQLEGESWRDRE